MPAATPPQADPRKRQLARIHVLRAELKLPEDEYRDLLGNLFDGRTSSTALTPVERDRLIAHLAGLQTKAGAQPPKQKPLSPRQAKMFSLWQQLADAGLVRECEMPGLKAWITRQTQVDRWEWLTSHQEDTVIESLKRWLARREGGTGGTGGSGVGAAGVGNG